MVLLISYDLRRPGQNYTALYDAIRSYGLWWHHLESTWIIETARSPGDVAAHLRNFIDSNDGLLVVQLVRNSNGWLPQQAWDWLNARNF